MILMIMMVGDLVSDKTEIVNIYFDSSRVLYL